MAEPTQDNRPPDQGVFATGFDQFAHHALQYSLILLFIIAVGLIIQGMSSTALPIGMAACAFLGLCYVLLMTRGVHLAGQVFVVGFWLLITSVILYENGINNVIYFGYVLVIIYSNVLILDRRWSIMMVTLCVLSTLLIYWGQINHILPVIETSVILLERLLIGLGVIGAAGILLFWTAHVLNMAFTDLQAREQELERRNQALEAMTEQLTASEARYRLLFQNLAVPATVYDRNGDIVLTNQATAELIGKPIDMLIGQNARDVLMRPDHVLSMNDEVFENKVATVFENQITLPDGQLFDYMRQVIPLPEDLTQTEDEQQFNEVLALTTDISEKKHNEARARELTLAQDKVAFYTEFFDTISHDIKTPLSVINTSLYLLKRSPSPERQNEKIAQIKQQVKMIEAYIQDLLMISRLQQVPTLSLEDIDISAMIRDIVSQQTAIIEDKGLDCRMIVQDALILRADRDQLRRALTNLIENAINYTPASGQVTISAIQQADQLQIHIQDTGIGIEQDDIPHIFDRFYRSLNAKRNLDSGTGLGLAIVKRIVDLHHGTITVQSISGQGSTFTLNLPQQPTEAIHHPADDTSAADGVS